MKIEIICYLVGMNCSRNTCRLAKFVNTSHRQNQNQCVFYTLYLLSLRIYDK